MHAHKRISRLSQSPQFGIIGFRPWRRSAQHRGSKVTAFNSPLAKSLLLNKRLPTASRAIWGIPVLIRSSIARQLKRAIATRPFSG
jgi:hypothetical protein